MPLKKCMQRTFKYVDENAAVASLNINCSITCKGDMPTIDKTFINASDIDIAISTLMNRSYKKNVSVRNII